MRAFRRWAGLIAALVWTGVAFAAPAAGPNAPRPDDMSLGNPNARVHVIEYASLSCSHCAAFHREVWPAFKAKYVDTGRVRFTLREVLTQPAQVAQAGFMLARCAGPAKYFDVVDRMFDGQALWATGTPAINVITSVGKSVGMTPEQVATCITDPAGEAAITARIERLGADKITGTPTFMVNGKIVGAGEVTLKQLDAAIAAAAQK